MRRVMGSNQYHCASLRIPDSVLIAVLRPVVRCLLPRTTGCALFSPSPVTRCFFALVHRSFLSPPPPLQLYGQWCFLPGHHRRTSLGAYKDYRPALPRALPAFPLIILGSILQYHDDARGVRLRTR